MKQVKTKQTTTAATTKYGHKAKYKQTNKQGKQTNNQRYGCNRVLKYDHLAMP